jgi:hypothetical protein
MIRIDEIYQSVFWEYLQRLPEPTRLFYFEPFGRTDPESLHCLHNNKNNEHNYIFLFDQEPINYQRHLASFQAVHTRCQNLYPDWPLRLPSTLNRNPILITSELHNPDVLKFCELYGYQHLHYFFHGWAALDWFRGYNRSFLITAPESRKIQKTFLMPNRIVGGERTHRVTMMYHIIKNNLLNNHISFPKTCPVENVNIGHIIDPLTSLYPDIQRVFDSVDLPINFKNETGHPMHSYQLSLFQESSECLLYLVSETVATGSKIHLTEKTFKPICLQMPFILVAGAGSLEYLRRYGFQTFGDFWDESYDLEPNDVVRFEKIAKVLSSLDSLSQPSKQKLFQDLQPILQHNFDHFYNGAFETILWNELRQVLNEF